LLDELPHPASATAEVANSTATATAAAPPRRRIVRGGDFMLSLAPNLFIFIVGLPP
jgi:hypothetical protein